MLYALILEHVAGALICSIMLRAYIGGWWDHVVLMMLWPLIVIPAVAWTDFHCTKAKAPPG